MEIPTNVAPYLHKIRLRDPGSHKGQNGKVLLIGGSELFHAASRWSLDVLASMVDMVFYSSVPTNNELIKEAKGEFWDGVVVERDEVESYLKEADVVLIGPGMTRDEKQHDAVESFAEPTKEEWNDTYVVTNYLLSKYPQKKWVIDAGALQMVDPKLLNHNCIITPHVGEMERLLAKVGGDEKALLKSGVVVLLKGPKDRVFSHGTEEWIEGGNAGMTKGGTGDVLAGLVAGLYVSTDDSFAAAVLGSFVNKKAGESLYNKVGPFFKTSQLASEIPIVLKTALYPDKEK